MLNVIIKAIFFVIGKIGDIVLLPIMAIVNSLFPNISFSLDHIFNYIAIGFQYITFIFKLLMIPPFCIQLVLAIFTFHFTLIVSVRTYHFIVYLYNKFKP